MPTVEVDVDSPGLLSYLELMSFITRLTAIFRTPLTQKRESQRALP
jgi:hypothetical protein